MSGTANPRQVPKKFFRSSFIYAAGDFLTKGAQIVLLPYYVSVLTTAEVGTLAVLTTLMLATFNVMAFALGFGIRRFYHEQEEHGDRFVTTLWVARFVGGLPVMAVTFLGALLLHRWMQSTIPLSLILMALTSGFLRAGLNLVETSYVIQEEPVKYRALTFFQFLTSTFLIIYLITYLKMGVAGAVLGELICYSIWTLISAYLLCSKSSPKFSAVVWPEMFWYCLPALPHVFFMWGVSAVDRLILEQHVSLAEIGVYDIGYKLASFLSVIMLAMRAAWLPNYFKTANQQGAQKRYAQMATVFFYVLFFGALCGILYAPEAVALITFRAATAYTGSINILRVVILGIAGFGMFVAFNQPLLYERKTGLVALASGAGLVANVAANAILIPHFGIMGAAIATVISYFLMALIALLIVNRKYHFEWEFLRIMVIFAIASACAILGCQLSTEINILNSVLKLMLLLAFPVFTLFRLHRTDQSKLQIKPHLPWSKNSFENGNLP